MHYYKQEPQEDKNENKKILVALLLLLLFPTVYFIYYREKINGSLGDQLLNPLSKTITMIKYDVETLFAKEETFSDVVGTSLQGIEDDYSVMIINLKTGKQYGHSENRVYDSASLYKLWVLGTVYQKIEKNEIKETDVLKKDVSLLNQRLEVSSESAEIKEGDIAMTVKQAINQMIVISHNYSALLLSDKLGAKAIATFLAQHGLTTSTYGSPPRTTAKDIALYYEKLYKGELANKESTQQMLDILKKQQINDRLPKLLPKDTVVAHKTGELGGNKHDAGIIYTPKGDYILVVLSKTPAPQVAVERIAKISEAVHSYFTK